VNPDLAIDLFKSTVVFALYVVAPFLGLTLVVGLVMSLIQSAKLNGHDPHAYLKDVLTSLPTHMNSRIDELLPHRWSPAWCPHVHDKTVDTYLLAITDKLKSRWGGRTLTL
jgi:hypothetical protein